MGQNLDSFTAEHDGGNAMPAVRGHNDQVASPLFCRVNNGLVRMLVLDVDRITGHGGGTPRYFAVVSAVRFA